jgi:hypothetical protein
MEDRVSLRVRRRTAPRNGDGDEYDVRAGRRDDGSNGGGGGGGGDGTSRSPAVTSSCLVDSVGGGGTPRKESRAASGVEWNGYERRSAAETTVHGRAVAPEPPVAG